MQSFIHKIKELTDSELHDPYNVLNLIKGEISQEEIQLQLNQVLSSKMDCLTSKERIIELKMVLRNLRHKLRPQ